MDLFLDTQEVRFCGYRLDTVTRRLEAPDGSDVPLSGRAYEVLAYLVANRPRVVGKDELLAAVWPGRVVEENNLSQAISSLRRALGAERGRHRFILTVPGRGYGFVAEIDEPSTDPVVPREVLQEPPMTSARRRVRLGVVAILAVALSVLAVSLWLVRSAPLPVAHDASATLAVLPFRALDKEPRDEMLELGIAETVIARLSRTEELRVLSLGSIQALVGQSFDPVNTGAELGASFVLDGHFQRSGDSIRITARLLALPAGTAVWSGTFDEASTRVFDVQDTIASSVMTALSTRYAILGKTSPCHGSDPEAYRAYLRGRFLLNRPDPRTIDTALASFVEAVDRDPACARAWAGIAAVRRTAVMVADRDPRVEFPLSDAAIDRALALDPDSVEAHVARGFNRFWNRWDWVGAEASLRRAIDLDPNAVDAHFTLAHLLANIGRHDEAEMEARRASALDPMSPLVNTVTANFDNDGEWQRRSLQRFNQVLAVEPDFWIALKHRSDILLEMGDVEGAERDALHAAKAANRNARSLVYLAMVYRHEGRLDRVRELLAELEQRSRSAYVLPSIMAQFHAMLDEPEQALDLLDEGRRQGDIGLSFLRPWFRSLGSEPRYAELLRILRLPPLGEDEVDSRAE